MSLIYLVGFMGVGKSTIGKALSQKLQWQHFDTDEVFENRFRISINNFFKKYSEDLFRKLENDILKQTFDLDNTVISCGGGTPCFFNSMEEINKNGLSIYLKMPLDKILYRLENSIRPRPLVKDIDKSASREKLRKLLENREEHYSKAKLVYDASNIKIDELLEAIRKK